MSNNYGFVQHGFHWYVTANGRRIGKPFKGPEGAKEAQAEARYMAAEKVPIADPNPKPRGRARKGKKPTQEASAEVLAEMNG